MAKHLQLVFSDPGDGVTDAEFDSWYEQHLEEILSIPGFLSAHEGDNGPALPRWWSDVRFGSWNCAPIGERVSVEA